MEIASERSDCDFLNEPLRIPQWMPRPKHQFFSFFSPFVCFLYNLIVSIPSRISRMFHKYSNWKLPASNVLDRCLAWWIGTGLDDREYSAAVISWWRQFILVVCRPSTHSIQATQSDHTTLGSSVVSKDANSFSNNLSWRTDYLVIITDFWRFHYNALYRASCQEAEKWWGRRQTLLYQRVNRLGNEMPTTKTYISSHK